MKDYILIKINKEILQNILLAILIIMAIITIFGIPYFVGKNVGHKEGFNEGYEYEWNKIVNALSNGDTVEMINKDGTTNMSIQKYSPIVFSDLTINPNPYFTTGSLYINKNWSSK